MKKILGGLLALFLFFNYGCSLNDTEKYLQELKSENVMVRNNAICYFGKKRVKSAVPILIERLKDDMPKDTKKKSIEALGEIGEGSSIDILVTFLGEKDSEIRIAACNALGKIKNSKAVKPLINILNDEKIRLTAVWALGHIGDKSAVPALTKLLNDQDKYVCYNAAQSLKKIGYGK